MTADYRWQANSCRSRSQMVVSVCCIASKIIGIDGNGFCGTALAPVESG